MGAMVELAQMSARPQHTVFCREQKLKRRGKPAH